MAGGYHAFGAGDVLTATNVDTYLMKQTVMPFATTTARDAALTSPTEGMMASTADRDIIWLYDGSAWQRVGSYSASGRTGCFVSRAANQSISASTLTTITFDTANTDNDSFHSGATFNQVVVLVDGVRVSDVQSGHYALDLAVPTAMIERIEILRGTGSAMYGSDAIGGVVNIVTRADSSFGELALRAGSFGGVLGQGSVGGVARGTQVRINDPKCVAKTFPDYFRVFQHIAEQTLI